MDVVGANVGTFSGSPTWGLGRETGPVLKLNGGHISHTALGVPAGSSARTFWAWISLTFNSLAVALGSTRTTGEGFFLYTGQTGGTYYIFSDGVNPANNATVAAADSPTVGTWNLIALSYEGSGNRVLRYYMNGTERKTSVNGGALAFGNILTTTLNTETPATVWAGDRSDASGPLAGYMSSYGIAARAFTAGEHLRLYNETYSMFLASQVDRYYAMLRRGVPGAYFRMLQQMGGGA